MKLSLILTLILSLLSTCVSGTRAAATVSKLAIGYSTINPRLSPLWIAQESRYFSKYSLEPTLILVRSNPCFTRGHEVGQHPCCVRRGRVDFGRIGRRTGSQNSCYF